MISRPSRNNICYGNITKTMESTTPNKYFYLTVGRQECDEIVEHSLEVLRKELVGLVQAQNFTFVDLSLNA